MRAPYRASTPIITAPEPKRASQGGHPALSYNATAPRTRTTNGKATTASGTTTRSDTRSQGRMRCDRMPQSNGRSVREFRQRETRVIDHLTLSRDRQSVAPQELPVVLASAIHMASRLFDARELQVRQAR